MAPRHKVKKACPVDARVSGPYRAEEVVFPTDPGLCPGLIEPAFQAGRRTGVSCEMQWPVDHKQNPRFTTPPPTH